MIKAAEQLGFSAKGVKGNKETFFSEFPLPCIAHVIVDGNLVVENVDRYIYKEQLLIVNALMALHKGHLAGVKETVGQLNQYMMDNKLDPITVVYNVTKRMDMVTPENMEIEMYVGINPNIL